MPTPPVKTAPVATRVARSRVPPPAAGDTSLQRYLDGTADAVDGVLQWLNAGFVYTPPGKDTSRPAVTTPAPLRFRVPISGPSASFDGAVSAGSVAASGAMSAGTVAAANSSFKLAVGGWTYYNASYPGGIVPAVTTNGAGSLESSLFGYLTPFAGSVVAINGKVIQSATAGFGAYYYVNGVSTAMGGSTIPANTLTSWGTTYAKGTFPFGVNTLLGIGCGWSVGAITVRFSGWMTLEMAP